MKKEQQPPQDRSLNANNAYSGSGSMQPGGGTGEPERLSDYPEGNATLNSPNDDPDSKPEGKSLADATDPSKLDKI